MFHRLLQTGILSAEPRAVDRMSAANSVETIGPSLRK